MVSQGRLKIGGWCNGTPKHRIASDQDILTFKRSNQSTFRMCRGCFTKKTTKYYGNTRIAVVLNCDDSVLFNPPWPQLGELLWCYRCQSWQAAVKYGKEQ